ncbi:hypothetical protein IV203_003235 [Nitzschia inconspicua]|uniref:Uncharacterized protein n=1 Tax=Nitzschia inconspicua TaxID=303405 RepID=A0A9K3L323_9STRA|nr:hypothetical protein IV203_003235 [Nitzschia inconspicua]
MLFLPDLGEGKERLQHCSSSSELPALRCRRQRRRLALEAARAAAPLRISLQPRMEPKNRYGASETPTAILSTISYASNLPYLDPDWANPQPLQQLSAKDEPSHCFASLSFRPTTSKRAPIFLAPRRRMTPNPSLVFFFSDRE